jgi:hypothetical protein
MRHLSMDTRVKPAYDEEKGFSSLSLGLIPLHRLTVRQRLLLEPK